MAFSNAIIRTAVDKISIDVARRYHRRYGY